MTEITVHVRSVDGTGAAAGWSGDYTIVFDRPSIRLHLEGNSGGCSERRKIGSV